MAPLTPVASAYNTRPRRKHSTISSSRSPDRGEAVRSVKRMKRDVFTPPASPEASEIIATQSTEETRDPILTGIIDFMQRCGVPSMCSREISEGLLQEGKIHLVGTTPSSVVDAAIKHYLKQCSAAAREPAILKVNDPRFPRKTLYHLAHIDPFSEAKPRVIPELRVIEPATPDTRMSVDRESAMSESEDGHEPGDALSNDGQGPFSAPIEERKRVSLSPSPEIEFALSIGEETKLPARTLTPPSSTAASKKEQAAQRVNITLPPSPFITPQHSDDEPDQESALKLPITAYTASPLSKTQDYDPNDFTDLHVRSPELITLHELDHLLDF